MKTLKINFKLLSAFIAVLLLYSNANLTAQVYSESFESGFGGWSNVGGDQLNWTRDRYGTPSNFTGPSTASDGEWYLYIESSGSAGGYKLAYLEKTFNFSSFDIPVVTFKYHMYGATMGSLSVDVFDGASWHYSIWSISGQQQLSSNEDWNLASIDLSDFAGNPNVTIRFNGTSGGDYRGDLAIDDIELFNYLINDLPEQYSDGFENCFSGGWSNVTGDDIDWTCYSGGTPSNNTGPSRANEGMNYMYIEASGYGTGYPNKQAYLESTFDFRNIEFPEMSFDYHMYGAAMGSLHIDVNDGAGWQTDVWVINGPQQFSSDDAWLNAVVDLSRLGTFNGVDIRFRGITGGDYSGDMSIDNIKIYNGVYVKPQIWYSYQSGDWDNWQVWTLDPSGTLLINPNNAIPASTDHAHILGGRTVTVNTNNKRVRYIKINEGGTLNTQATTGHSFTKIDGQGVYKLSTANLDIPASGGAFFQAGGGTVEYSGAGTGALFKDFEYNNLIINMQNGNDRVTILDNLTIHGDLTVQNGYFRINNNSASTALDITVKGSVNVASSGKISVGTENVYHTMSCGGDFNNYGTVRFTNRAAPLQNSYYITDPTQGGVIFSFKGEGDNELNCYNTTDFHRFILDKGSDPTYVLTVNSTDNDNFRLFGRRDKEAASYNTTDENPAEIIKALWIRNGTLKLEGKISIPSLAEGGKDNFIVPLNGALWLNSPDVYIKVSTGVQTGGNRAVIPIGNIVVDDGVLDCGTGGGIVFRGPSQFIVNGGSVRATQYRPSSFAINCVSAFIQTGGIVNLDGRGEINGDKAIFCLPFPDNSFSMTGGQLNIGCATGSGAFMIGCSEENSDVSGGEINFNLTDAQANDFTVNSQVPLYNVNVEKTNGSQSSVSLASLSAGGFMAGVPNVTLPLNDLTVKNDLSIISGNNPNFNANNANVIIGGDFSIQTNTSYTPGSNTTIFNGGDLQNFVVDGTIDNDLNNLSIINKSDLTINNSDITVKSDLLIDEKCVLRDGGQIIHAKGDIENNGTHYKPVSGAGSIRLDGDVAQLIKGNGNGIFNNLTINQSVAGASVKMDCDATVTGNLRLAGIGNDAVPAHFNIQNNKLTLTDEANVYTGIAGSNTDFDHNRMILTTGFMSDGGVKKQISSINGFTFPFGFENSGTFYYMPANISMLSAPSQFGSITSRPVNQRHPLTSTTDALSCYWKTEAEEFADIVANSVIHKYYYDNELSNDFVNGDESLYLSAVYQGGTDWKYINSSIKVNPATNEIKYDNDSQITGDYTAGEFSAFGSIPVLYSVAHGDWNDPNTWSDTRGGTNHPGVPTANTVVNICDNDSVYINENGKIIGGLSIEEGSILDLKTTTGHNFTILSDNLESKGTMRISGSYFPQGDLGFILGENGGTIEYYTTGADFTVPSFSDGTNMSLKTYNNLKLTHSGSYTITLPNNDLHIYDDLIVNGSGTRRVVSNTNSDFKIEIDSNLVIKSGKLRYETGSQLDIIVKNDVIVKSGADFRVRNSATDENSLTIYGSLINDGNILFNNTGYVHLYFKGETDEVIDGSGSNNFYSVTIDKGLDYTPILTVNRQFSTALDPAISLLNGTFRWNVAGQGFDLSINQDFTIPSTACASVSNGILRTNAGDNNLTLYLQGKLEVLDGIFRVGATPKDYHNDIELSAAGTPEIIINGGELHVNGAIRRTTLNTMGALQYTQTDGKVFIYGKNQTVDDQVIRSVFEIANENSLFNMSGGEITISRTTSGTNFGDVYLRPAESTVTGGTIKIVGALDYLIDADCSLYNVEIGDGTNVSNVSVWVNDLDVNGDLTIKSNSTLSSGNQSVDMYVAGDFLNNGAFTANENNFTFDGANAQIATYNTNTNFYELTVDKSAGAVSFTGTAQPSVSEKLTLENGTLDDGGRTITVYGDITNNATHQSTGGGSIYITNTSGVQFVDGNDNGQFGNFTLDNADGIVFKDNMTINQTLTFIDGKLDIGRELLTFGENAPIPTGFSEDLYIVTNGALSDRGVKKIYPAVSPASFTYPIGIADKYTPVSYTVDYTVPGSIKVAPVNSKVPSTNLFDDELQYFWNVVSEDFGGLTSIDHSYTYLPEDIIGTTETDADFVGGRYVNYIWTDLGHSVINTADHRIDIVSANYIDGDYTCGYYTNFVHKPILYSRVGATNIETTGSTWEDGATWTTDPSHNGPAYTEAPSGNPIVVKDGHRVNVTTGFRTAYSVVDSGIVAVGTTIGHNFGKISGNGRIITQNTGGGSLVVPGGNYEEFVNTPDATIEYNCVNAPYGQTLPSLETYQDVDFTGDEQIDLTMIDITVQGNVLITCPTLNNALFNKDITVFQNWTNTNTSANSWIPGRSTVTFADEYVSYLNAGTTESFYNLEMDRNDKSYDLILNAPVDVTNKLILNTANVISDNTNILTLTSTSPSAITGGSINSFVDGPLRKNILNTSRFGFHVGKDDRYGYMDLYDVQESSSPSYWTVEYFDQNPQAVYTNAMNPPLTSISDNEYWEVSAPGAIASNNAKLRLRWDDKSYPYETTDPIARKYLRVVEYDGSTVWDERGKDFYPNKNNPTMVGTENNVTDDAYVFTLGIAGVTATLTDVVSTDICNDGTVTTMPVEFTGEPNFTLTYRVTNTATAEYVDFTMSGITGLSTNITLSGADIEAILATDATTDLQVTLLTIKDGNNKAGVCFGATDFSVLLTYTPEIVGSFEVGTGETRPYTTDLHSGTTYNWSWDGTSGGTINSPASNATDIQFNSVITPKYFDLEITETVTSTGCTMTDIQTIALNHVPVPEILPDDLNICQGETVSYSTVYNTGHEYIWTVTGGSCTGCGSWRNGAGSNEITVVWNTSGTGTIEVIESTDGSHSVVGSDENVLLISEGISAYNVTGDDPFLCIGDATNINVSNSQIDVDYDLRNEDTDALIATATGTGGTLAIPTGSIPATTTYYVLAYNQGCEALQNGTPVVTIASDFYAKAGSDASELANWGTNTDGSGKNPLAFDIAGTKLHVENNAYLSKMLELGTDVILYNNFGSEFNADTYSLIADSIENTNGTVQFAGPANGFAITTGTVEYNGGVQTVAGGEYYSLKINGTGQKHLIAPAEVNGVLSMLDGSLATTRTNILTLSETASVAVPTNPTSFVDGPMVHTVASVASESKVFPVGSDGLLRRIDITVQHTDATPTTYTANYTRASAQPLHTLPSTANLSHVSSVGYWHIDKSNKLVSLDGITDANLVSATATLFYVDDDFVRVPNDLRVAKSNDVQGLWENHGGTVDLAQRSITTGTFRTFCDLCLADENGINPLPITLLNFNAKSAGNSVNIEWTTVTETNNDFFTLESSSDGRSFSPIAYIDGAGTSSTLNEYDYTDKNLPNGIMYYRLKQTDFDGTVSYSNVISVYILGTHGNSTEFVIFPNPSEFESIKMRINSDEDKTLGIHVVNTLGQTMYSGTVETKAGITEYLLQNIFILEPGEYFIIIDKDVTSRKMFIIK